MFRVSGRSHSVVALVLSLTAAAQAREIHVAKTGDDASAGTLDAPYLTVSQAAVVAEPGDDVIIHAGTYEETLTPARSGSPGSPIVFRGAPGEKVILTAMQALSGWTVDSGPVYRTAVDWDLGQENFVMHEQRALDLARWPNNVDADPYTMDSLRSTGGSGSDVIYDAYLDYGGGIPDVGWEAGGSIHFYGDKPGGGWTAWRAFIKSSSATRVSFDLDKDPAWIRTWHDPASGGEFFLQGVKGALDYENEWYFDPAAHELFVQLPGGQAPADGSVQMRRRMMTVDLRGRDHVEIQDLAVFGGTIEIRGTGNRLYRVSSFYGNHTLGVVTGFSSGSQSVFVSWGATDNTIERCEVGHGSGTGIYDAGTRTRVLDSYVHDFNTLGNYDAVLNVRGPGSGEYTGNTLNGGGRDVIQSFGAGSVYSYNDVSRSNLLADDCALFYTVGDQSNTILHHNWFHDAASHGPLYKAAGIYLDNDARNLQVHHNVVWNTEWTNIQINWNGANLDIFNNTLVDGSATMGAWHQTGTAFDVATVRVYNNLSDGSEWEPQSTRLTNLTYSGDPFTDLLGGDFSLRVGTEPIDAGTPIAGITDGYQGSAPDIGAYEYGQAPWAPGIDWDRLAGPTGTGCYRLPGEACEDGAGGTGGTAGSGGSSAVGGGDSGGSGGSADAGGAPAVTGGTGGLPTLTGGSGGLVEAGGSGGDPALTGGAGSTPSSGGAPAATGGAPPGTPVGGGETGGPAPAAESAESSNDGSCGCRVSDHPSRSRLLAWLVLAACVPLRRRAGRRAPSTC